MQSRLSRPLPPPSGWLEQRIRSLPTARVHCTFHRAVPFVCSSCLASGVVRLKFNNERPCTRALISFARAGGACEYAGQSRCWAGALARTRCTSDDERTLSLSSSSSGSDWILFCTGESWLVGWLPPCPVLSPVELDDAAKVASSLVSGAAGVQIARELVLLRSRFLDETRLTLERFGIQTRI